MSNIMLLWITAFLLSLLKTRSESRCEELTIPMCKEIGYSSVRFPNEMGQSNQRDALSELNYLESFIETGCSSDLKIFLCSLYAPYCNEDAAEEVLPCRDLCINVRDRCLPVMIEKFAYDYWPNSWKCGRFPYEKGRCVEGVEKPLTDPPETFVTEEGEPTEKPTDKSSDPDTDDTFVIENNSCRADQLPCDGGCVPLTYRCDKFEDCQDGADEIHCDKCLSSQFMCTDRTQCVPLTSKCDQIPDCSDASDEEGCSMCASYEFLCDGNRCLSNMLRCDTKVDCKDNSDEQNCGTCAPGTWQCSNGKCIDENNKCDGDNDCGDNSDETSDDANCPVVPEEKEEDNTNPDPNTDEETDNDGNNSEYELSECTKSTRDCNLDVDCKKEMDNYRRQCQQQIESTKMIKCPMGCFNAYYQLNSRKYGSTIISEQCEQLGVQNVKYSCIRSPANLECLEGRSECMNSVVCKDLYSAFIRECGEVLNNNAECRKSCIDAYQSLVASSTSDKLQDLCIEISTTIPVRCGPMSNALDSSAQSTSTKNGAHRLYAILLTVTLLYHTLLSST